MNSSLLILSRGQTVGRVLAESGFRTTTSSSPQVLFDLARASRPAAVLCDGTPTEGLEVFLLLRAHPDTHTIPVILLGEPPEVISEACLRQGGFLLRTPCSTDALLNLLVHATTAPVQPASLPPLAA